MPNEQLLGLLGIAAKAGRLHTGEQTVCALAREKRARLILLASDAGSSTERRIRQLAEGTAQPVVRLALGRQALGGAAGKALCAAAAFSDVSFALAFARLLPEGTLTQEALDDLEARTKRVRARKQGKAGASGPGASGGGAIRGSLPTGETRRRQSKQKAKR